MSTNNDQHIPHADGRWAFDASVTSNFDAMLSASIPEYETMRKLCFDLGKHFVKESKCVVDIGASRGEAIDPFIKNTVADTFYALEISDPMLEVLKDRYQTRKNVSVLKHDLRQSTKHYTPFLPERNSLVLSVLTLQFVPIEYRHKLLSTIYGSLCEGGAMILVEKVLGNTGALDDVFVKEYYDMKHANGYSYEDIQRKKASLEGVLVPVTMNWNSELLRNAGFTQIDCFYRHLNFGALLAIKG